MPKLNAQNLNAVSELLLAPLYFRVIESRRADPLLKDDHAVPLLDEIDYDFSRFERWSTDDKVLTLLRMKTFDRHARAFLARHPGGVIVEIGCGLDTRFYRVDNGQVEWYDLDLPEVMALRQTLIGETPRSHCLAASAFDFAWLDLVRHAAHRPCLFLAEGVFVYFEEAQVKALVLKLKDRFPGAELAFDAMSPFFVWLHSLKLAQSQSQARLHFSLKNAREVEAWGAGIRLLDEWRYFDQPEPRLGAMNLVRYFPALNRGNSIVDYRLGE